MESKENNINKPTNPMKEYSNIDIETRAKISLRKKMGQDFENGTFYKNNKDKIPLNNYNNYNKSTQPLILMIGIL